MVDKFIFFPNYIVTKDMFDFLMKYIDYTQAKFYNYLITGGFGISKTVSLVLFIHLTYHQTQYVYKALKD
jgi:hypothetical protein